jgi:dipeptidyl aminopeptidase/acylaminoacyl peptidase
LVALDEIRNKHEGQDVFVLGSGKSLDFYPEDFFDNRITVAVNQGWANRFPRVDYMVTKYHQAALRFAEDDRVGLVVTTKGERGHSSDYLDDERLLIVDHNNNPVEAFSAADWPEQQNKLVVSHSSITTAMHFAAVLGARTIFVVGADCGLLNGATNLDGHPAGATNLDSLRSFERHNRIVADELRKRYGVQMVGLSPFLTFNLGGNRFESYAGVLNAS